MSTSGDQHCTTGPTLALTDGMLGAELAGSSTQQITRAGCRQATAVAAGAGHAAGRIRHGIRVM